MARTIGARLRELRLECGLSVRDLERRSGVNRSTISELRIIGRGFTVEQKAAGERAARTRIRQMWAEMGLTGYRKPRPKHVPWKPPEHTRRRK
jgi:hypothetical protein